jgi:cholesterol transport system auxiliary component
LACVALLAACSGGATLETFDLSALPGGASARAPRGQLVVAEPLASPPLDSDRLIVRPSPDTVATLKGAQWSDRLPRLVQTRLVQSFENSRLLRSVARPEAKIRADATLSAEIRRFDIDIAAGQAVVEISVRLVAEKTGRILAARIFEARAAGSATEGGMAAQALDHALADVLRQIVGWASGSL